MYVLLSFIANYLLLVFLSFSLVYSTVDKLSLDEIQVLCRRASQGLTTVLTEVLMQ